MDSKNIVVIFDDLFDTKHLSRLPHDCSYVFHLFPLTSNFLTIDKLKSALQNLSNVRVELLDSANFINDEVNTMQKTVHTWSSDLGNLRVGKKKLKEWFVLPDGGSSAWWFSLIAEKNTVQDDAFFKIAQLNAIKSYIERVSPYSCVLIISHRSFKNRVKSTLTAIKQAYQVIPPVVTTKITLKQRLLQTMKRAGLTGAFLQAMLHWVIWLKEGNCARRSLQAPNKRLRQDNPLLFISYFPNIDGKAAQAGIFRNKYALAIQDKLKERGIPITWLLMPVFYDGHRFASSMALAHTFAENGESLFVLQEFFTFKVFFKSLIWWLRQSILCLILYHCINKRHFTGQLTHKQSLPIIKNMWWQSFIGEYGVRGLNFYLTYLQVFNEISHVKQCLYYCEMQAWEKAMIAAKNKVSPAIQTLAFQHTVVMRNFFNYFYNARDMTEASKIDMPLPDKLIANGKMTHTLLAESNYPRLCQAEAIRQLYLNKTMDLLGQVTEYTPRKNVFLIAGSCDRKEMTSVISMVYQAFPRGDNFEIWFKGSPVNPLEPIFQSLHIDIQKTNYKIVHEDIAEVLKSTKAALVANTTVSIEAMAFGCTVIIPVLADTMLLNPILESQSKFHLVTSSTQLNRLVVNIMREQITSQPMKHAIENYWNINPKLPLWTNILQI